MSKDESCSVNWGDIGFPIAALKLLRLATSQATYNHYMLISGQDYPVRPMSELLDFLSKGGDYLDFVEGIRFDSGYLLYYPSWLIGKEVWKRPIRGIYKCLGMGPFARILQRKNRPFCKILTYIDWSANGPSPEVLTVKDFDSIIRSKKFFARKMETESSTLLLNLLDDAVLVNTKVESCV